MATDERQRWRKFGIWFESLMLSRMPSKNELARTSGVAFNSINDLVNGGRIIGPGGDWRLPNPFDSTFSKLANALGKTDEERKQIEREMFERAGGSYRERNPDRAATPRRRDELEDLRSRVAEVEQQLLKMREERDEEEQRRREGG
jgi:plasmid maintenance system antidote protein VapI